MKLLIASITLLLASCGGSRHIHRADTSRTVTDTREADSLRQVITALHAHYESLLREQSYASVIFDTLYLSGDTVRPVVTIQPNGAIQASGRVKSATVTNDRLQRTLSDLQTRYDSLYQVKQRTVQTTETKTVEVDKRVKRGWPWWIWLLIGATTCWVWMSRYKIIDRLRGVRI